MTRSQPIVLLACSAGACAYSLDLPADATGGSSFATAPTTGGDPAPGAETGDNLPVSTTGSEGASGGIKVSLCGECKSNASCAPMGMTATTRTSTPSPARPTGRPAADNEIGFGGL